MSPVYFGLYHDPESVTQSLALLHAVRGEDDAGPAPPDVVDRLPDLPPGGGVHTRGGLVQQHHLVSTNKKLVHICINQSEISIH